MSTGCWSITVLDTIITWTHLFPTMIFLGLWVGSLRKDGKKEIFVWTYSFYLTFWSYILWAIQTGIARNRPHELCGHLYTFAFPSVESFLIGNLVAAFLTYAYIKRIDLSWLSWFIMYSLIFIPQSLMIMSGMNVWWETLVSFSAGLLTSMLFVSVSLLYLRPYVPYLLIQSPFTWFHITDTYCCDRDGEIETQLWIHRHGL